MSDTFSPRKFLIEMKLVVTIYRVTVDLTLSKFKRSKRSTKSGTEVTKCNLGVLYHAEDCSLMKIVSTRVPSQNVRCTLYTVHFVWNSTSALRWNCMLGVEDPVYDLFSTYLGRTLNLCIFGVL